MSGGLRARPMAATGEIYSEKQINYPTGGNMLLNIRVYPDLGSAHHSFNRKQQRTTTAGRRISLPGSTNWRSTMKTTKTFATALMFCWPRWAPPPTPRPTSNRTTCRSRASTARRMKARAAPRCRPPSCQAKAAAKAAGQVWNVEPNDTPFAGVYGTPYNGPSRAQVEADLASAKIAGQVSNVEPTTCRSPASITANDTAGAARPRPATNNPPLCCISPPAVPGRHFCPAASAPPAKNHGNMAPFPAGVGQ